MERSKLITQLSLKNGFILALISIVISLLMHFVDPMLAYKSSMLMLSLMIVYIGLMVYAGITIRKEIGGYWTFGEAFKAFLIISLVICISSTLYNVVLMGIVDPTLAERGGELIDAKTREFMLGVGMSEEQVEQEMAKAGSGADRLEVNFKNTVTSFGVVLALYGVISLILAAILKKNPPVRLEMDEYEKGTV
jgi:prepilin signal peptidase PulO-like enzyme (type II secretory pathway)